MFTIAFHWLAGWREEIKLPKPQPIFQPYLLIPRSLIMIEQDFARGPPVNRV